MSIATFPKSVNGRVNTVPECGPPPTAELEPHVCRRPAYCLEEACIVARGRKKQEDIRALAKFQAAVQLAGILGMADQLTTEIRRFMNEHGPNHKCRVCNYLRREVEHAGGGYALWWEDLLVLRSNLEANSSILLHSTPGAITYELIRDQYEGKDDE